MPKVAVVTGANKGIGFAIVRGLCKRFDGDVYLTSRDPGRGQAAVKELEKEGGLKPPKFHPLDITDRGSIAKLAEFLASEYGGLDVLVNNAGMAYKSASNAPFVEQAEVTVRTNYTGTVDVCEALFPLLRRGARVVHLASFVGEMTFAKLSKGLQDMVIGMSTTEEVSAFMQQFVEDVKVGIHEREGWPSMAYGMSKLGQIMCAERQQAAFDQSSRSRGKDIVVNAACPGRVKTDMSSQSGDLTIDEGADTPLYLALLPEGVQSPRGCFCKTRDVCDWKNTAK